MPCVQPPPLEKCTRVRAASYLNHIFASGLQELWLLTAVTECIGICKEQKQIICIIQIIFETFQSHSFTHLLFLFYFPLQVIQQGNKYFFKQSNSNILWFNHIYLRQGTTRWKHFLPLLPYCSTCCKGSTQSSCLMRSPARLRGHLLQEGSSTATARMSICTEPWQDAAWGSWCTSPYKTRSWTAR